jgi:hypothetical protein
MNARANLEWKACQRCSSVIQGKEQIVESMSLRRAGKHVVEVQVDQVAMVIEEIGIARMAYTASGKTFNPNENNGSHWHTWCPAVR